MYILATVLFSTFYFILIMRVTRHAYVLALTFSVVLGAIFELTLSMIVLAKILTYALVLVLDFTVFGTPRIRRDTVIKNGLLMAAALVGVVPGTLVSLSQSVDLGNYVVAYFLAFSPLFGYLIGSSVPSQNQSRTGSVSILILTFPIYLLVARGIFLGLDRLVFGSIAVGGLYGHLLFVILLADHFNMKYRSFGLLMSIFDVLYGGSRRYLVAIFMPAIVVRFIGSGDGRGVSGRNLLLRLVAIGTIISLVLLFLVAFSDGSAKIELRGVGYRTAQNQIFISKMSSIFVMAFGVGAGFTEVVQYSWVWFSDFGPRLHSYFYSIIMNFGLWGIALCVVPYVVALFQFRGRGNEIFFWFGIGWLISAQFDTPPDGLWVIGWAAGVSEKRWRNFVRR